MAPSSSPSPTTSVQVALRIRPPTSQDSNSIPARFQRSVIQAITPTAVAIESTPNAPQGTVASPASTVSLGTPKKQVFSFDQVHPPKTTQYELFLSTAKPLISRFLEGFNCTILAYGQTSSGKTFTMTGIDLDADPSDPSNGMGIIPRAVSTIFANAKSLKDERGGAWNYNIKGSFIEIYNEDLIDLLSLDDTVGGRREVQIREDKEGHIIWGGLREVNVRNASEVMGLLRKGTAIRRTNETDMNAQSSRSHAIFSLTLTQKKYTGSNPPPRSPSPLPPGGRSPSRLARPGSMYAGPSGNRVGSPTFGRPSTPSFAAAMGRGGGLRPASSLGHTGERSSSNLAVDDDAGEWVTIVSKFHFVDLAGSERLKRTAAAGERIKEGISINSGLLALGNVISALGDPSRVKSNTATHVPYRDSKLTRLLQDSLGGNAHTLMIACVSPAEWNAGETVNTLKYANRARNIKNRAVVNEKEDGWDDVEWLQSTVTRLRKELKVIKEGGPVSTSTKEPEVLEGAGKKVLAQLTELQSNYEDLREKFVERTEELTRLRRELGERHRANSHGAIGGTAKYEEIVGPVIEEYEKTIAAMEAELNLNRAALRHTNEMVEEKEDENSALSERHAATELYVEELRARVAKLTEREASTEAYVRDLEDRMKAYDETSITSSESMVDLKRELTRLKETESHSSQYIADLEARLTRSDESVLVLQRTVENLEKECDKRRDEVEILQSRLEAFRRDGESWRSDLEERERKIKLLEQKMLDWERKKKDAGEVRIRLGNVVEEVESAKKELEGDLTTSSSPTSAVAVGLPESGDALEKELEPSLVAKPDETLQSQLIALQQTHTATLADLNSVTSKYRDALREISDLAAQIQEAKLSSNVNDLTVIDSPLTESPGETLSPSVRKRIAGGRTRELSEPQFNSAGRRLFFRQAASADSLHSRSLSQSQSLSQELSSVHSRKTSFSSHGTSSSHSPSHSHSNSTLSNMGARATLSVSLPTMPPTVHANERSVSSLEKEIMRLQEVLKEREAEITLLEESLKQSQTDKSIDVVNVGNETNSTQDTDGSATSLSTDLSPKTRHHFDHIRQSMVHGNGLLIENETDPDESLERLNELMLSMAQKESHHRDVVDELNSQLTQTRRQLDDLTALSRDQAVNMSKEMEVLRSKHIDDLTLLEETRQHEAELLESLEQAQVTYKAELERLKVEHQETLEAKGAEVDALIARMTEEHESSLTTLRGELESAKNDLQTAIKSHEEAFGRLSSEYEERLQRQISDADSVLADTVKEHEKSMSKILGEHAIAIRQKDEEASTNLQTTEEQYYNALTKLRDDHAEAIKKVTAEFTASMERLREEHAGELRMAEISREGSISESESARNLALKGLQEEHAAAIARKESSFLEEIENIKSGHARALKAKDDDYSLQMDRLRLEHETNVAKLRAERSAEVDQLQASFSSEKEESLSSLASSLKQQAETELQNVKEQHAFILRELERGHEEEVQRLKSTHEASLQNLSSDVDKKHAAIIQSHADEIMEINRSNEQKIAELTADISSRQEELEKALQDMRKSHEEDLSSEKERYRVAIDELHKQHEISLIAENERGTAALEDFRQQSESLLVEERAMRDSTASDLNRKQEELVTLREDFDILSQEVEAYKVASDESVLLREQARIKHERELGEKSQAVSSLEEQLHVVSGERDELESEVANLRAELDKTRNAQSRLIQEASKRESLVGELERHRSVLAELQENLQKVKDEKDVLQTEKNRADSLIRDLQAQIARSSSPPNARSPDRSVGYPRATNLPPIKLPPPTPPPSIPPPPAPRATTAQHLNGDSNLSTSSQGSSTFNSSTSSRESQPDSPSTSVGHVTPNGNSLTPNGITNGTNGSLPVDPKVTVKLEQQAKLIDEQEAMIKTLNKQLTHCESDLQTHMDLVTTLETSLGDSEKNLRKARMQATELARERDTLSTKLDALRTELSEAKREVVTVRRSIVEEKQSLEQRLDEERKAKERARQQLDSRMEELQKRKSKFACL